MTHTDTIATVPNLVAVDAALLRLRRYVRAANRWFDYVETLTGPAPKRPSKDAKHRAYGDASYIVGQIGGDRPHTFPQLCAIAGLPCSEYALSAYAKNGNSR